MTSKVLPLTVAPDYFQISRGDLNLSLSKSERDEWDMARAPFPRRPNYQPGRAVTRTPGQPE